MYSNSKFKKKVQHIHALEYYIISKNCVMEEHTII